MLGEARHQTAKRLLKWLLKKQDCLPKRCSPINSASMLPPSARLCPQLSTALIRHE
jgi:hypothetical protein